MTTNLSSPPLPFTEKFCAHPKSAIKISSLDHISGIGESRKKALLNYFGSFKSIIEATITELCSVEGISKELAKPMHESLR